MKVTLQQAASNFHRVNIGALGILFSYETAIAVYHPSLPDSGFLVSENIWSKTTGKHLNALPCDKADRVPHQVVLDKITELLAA